MLSIGIAYVLNIGVQYFPSKYSSWYFLIDTIGVLGAYGLLYKMFDEHLWKYLPWNCFGVVDFPNLEGRWEGKILSSYNNRSTPYKSALEIKQTFSQIKVCMYMERSRSYSLIADFIKDETGQTSLHYEYRNEPNQRAESTMNIHLGTGSILFHADKMAIEGEYYNSPRYGRGNSGNYEFKFVQKKLLHHF